MTSAGAFCSASRRTALWGLFPLYWTLLEPAGAVEILAHRICWSLVTMVGLTFALRRTPQLRAILRDRRGSSACSPWRPW